MNLIKKVEEDRIDKAVETIKGYCTKHFNCETCRFYEKESYDCVLSKNIPPCDWSVNDEK
jgi:hypothetical protein